jgi:hypothetical protein
VSSYSSSFRLIFLFLFVARGTVTPTCRYIQDTLRFIIIIIILFFERLACVRSACMRDGFSLFLSPVYFVTHGLCDFFLQVHTLVRISTRYFGNTHCLYIEADSKRFFVFFTKDVT